MNKTSISYWRLYPPGFRHTALWDDYANEKESKVYGTDIFPWNPGQRPAGAHLHVRVGKTLVDVLWTQYNQCLIQDRVRHMFLEQGFTGWEALPVATKLKSYVKEIDPSEIPTYWELRVTGWGGIAPPESGITSVPSSDEERLSYTSWTDASKLLDYKQWDGSDFFMIWPLPRFIFVTERVAEFIRTQKLKGIELIDHKDLKTSSKTLSPGRLRLWMPEERARELGEPLGIY